MSNETKNNDSAHPYTYTGHNPNEVTEPDYKALYEAEKAKYEALVESVKDAIVEIRDNSNMSASLMLSKSDKSYGYISEGMDDAISILKRKTGVYPL
jgi:hypothetical protein